MSKLATLLARALNCVALSVCAVAPVAAQAQTAPPRRDAPPAVASPAASPTPASPAASPASATNATGEPDLSITANVTARELVFEVVPAPEVEFPGRPRRDTVWEAERTNLPPQVQPGVTYRDIGIRLKITSVFADIERIVAEALGEIPASDDAPTKTDPNESAPPPDGNTQPPTGDAQPPTGDAHAKTVEAAQPGDARTSISLTQTSHTPPPSSQARRARARSGGAQARRERQ